MEARLAHASFQVPGFRAMGVPCGIKSGNRPDLALIVSDQPGTAAAVVTTQNAFVAAPVHVTRQHAADGRAQAIVVNSGNANACTGRQGLRDALTMARQTATALGLVDQDVLVASTGIIGRPLPMPQISQGIEACVARLDEGTGNEAAHAILTTDSGPKQARATIQIEGKPITIAGFAKGAGMIHPNMATMLAFVATDAAIPPTHLRQALLAATAVSFNQISVDGCESTNDMAMVLANGVARHEPLHPEHPSWSDFQAALTSVCQQLAKQIAADGEGATRLLEVEVSGVRTDEDARCVARGIVASNLVKAAVHGQDPNWGRVVAAAGQLGVPLTVEEASLGIGPPGKEEWLLWKGVPASSAGQARDLLGRSVARLHLMVGDGPGRGTAWGCDLTPDYVTFNADYHT